MHINYNTQSPTVGLMQKSKNIYQIFKINFTVLVNGKCT